MARDRGKTQCRGGLGTLRLPWNAPNGFGSFSTQLAQQEARRRIDGNGDVAATARGCLEATCYARAAEKLRRLKEPLSIFAFEIFWGVFWIPRVTWLRNQKLSMTNGLLSCRTSKVTTKVVFVVIY